MPSQAETCGEWVKRVVLLDVTNKKLPFQLFLRKLVLLANACILFVLVYYVLTLIATPSDETSQIVKISDFVGGVWSFATFGGTYLYAAKTGTVPDLCLLINALAGIVGVTLNSIGAPSLPLLPSIVAIMFQATVCGLPYRKVFFCLSTVAYAVISYNFAGIVTGSKAGLAFEGYREPSFAEVFFSCWVGYALVFLPVACCIMSVTHQAKMIEAAEATITLSATVARLLRAYDTDAVKGALDEYEAAGAADPDLVASYRALVANLDRYRAHLPNWVVRPRRDNGSDNGSDPASVASSERASQQSPQQSPGNSLRDEKPNVLRSPASPHALVAESHESRHQEDNAAESIDLDGLLCLGRVVSDVAYALVDFRVGALDSDSAAQASIVGDFVDLVSYLATSTQGALHSFVGDTVQMSWNAAMNSAHPEVKAARFLCKLKIAMESTPSQSLSIAGAVMSGKASSQFGGSGYVSAFVLSLPWRAKLLACFALAKRHRAYVCAGSIVEAAGPTIVTRAVELLSVSQNGRESAVVVHELLGQRAPADLNDNWLYLQGGEAPVASPAVVGDPLQLCIEGFYADAITALGDPKQDESALVANLRARALCAQLQPPQTFGTRLCCCDDTPLVV
jgi:hypothetical protein